jgi:hypothetical protein
MYCLNCKKPIKKTNKFCNNSCAATYNNTRRILKITTNKCKACGNNFNVNHKQRARVNCDNCVKSKKYIKDRYLQYREKTVKQIKHEHNAEHGRPWTDRIRGYARTQHSDKSPCVNCGYSLHTEVCHKKAISDFPDSATVAEINSDDNIVFLCRNCHWEFDHNYLQLV